MIKIVMIIAFLVKNFVSMVIFLSVIMNLIYINLMKILTFLLKKIFQSNNALNISILNQLITF